jgi:ABC-2 type transport system permease protein
MLNKIFTVARFTLHELLKSKILFVTLFIGVLIAIATFVATEFTYGTPVKIALDFGFGMLSLSSLGISLFMGASLLPNELDSRTVYMVISRPVPRWCFILGKVLGLMGVLCINVLILSLFMIICLLLLGGELNQAIFLTAAFNILECLLLLLVVVFLSLFLNSILSSSVAFSLLFLGHAVQETQSITFVQNRAIFEYILKAYHFFLPAFYKLNFKDFIVYEKVIPGELLITSFLYSVSYSLGLILLIIYSFNRKNLD